MFSITVRDTTPPTAPAGLNATAVSSTEIDLSWTASYDAVGVTGYRIYRSLDNISFAPIGTSTGTAFYDTGLIPNTTYYYYVRAFDRAGNPSNPSNTASARTFPEPPNPPPPPPPAITSPTPTATANPCTSGDNTPKGQTIVYAPSPNLNLTFDAILQCGNTTAVAYYNNIWTPLPNNYKPIQFYDIETTSYYANYITIQVTYSDSAVANLNENSIRLFHYENGNWVDVTIALDTTANIVTGRVTSLSPFAIAGIPSGDNSGAKQVLGPSFGNAGFVVLVSCLIAISILGMKRKVKHEERN